MFSIRGNLESSTPSLATAAQHQVEQFSSSCQFVLIEARVAAAVKCCPDFANANVLKPQNAAEGRAAGCKYHPSPLLPLFHTFLELFAKLFTLLLRGFFLTFDGSAESMEILHGGVGFAAASSSPVLHAAYMALMFCCLRAVEEG